MPDDRPPSRTLLNVLSDRLRGLALRGEEKRYRKGHRLIEEGDLGDTLFILVVGRVRVFSEGSRGRELTHGLYGPGECVGELSLDGGRRSASVEAIEDIVVVLITRRTLLGYITDCPEFALDLIAKVIHRARVATSASKRMALSDVYERLTGLLQELAVPLEDGQRLIGARPTHKEVARQLGCSREMISRLTKDLERGGYLTTAGNGWVINRPLPSHW